MAIKVLTTEDRGGVVRQGLRARSGASIEARVFGIATKLGVRGRAALYAVRIGWVGVEEIDEESW